VKAELPGERRESGKDISSPLFDSPPPMSDA
jgi:hypothetical protein